MEWTRYQNATVAWAENSRQDTVALRPNGWSIAYLCEFKNRRELMIAVSAGLGGRRVDFVTTGEIGGVWQNVEIETVH